ncbi:MAG TPA: hypothetical protein VF841_04615 [Anaeromyxobacter sp.]
MRTRRSFARAALVLAAALAAAGCGNFAKGREDADRAVAEFHAQFNAGSYDAIWDASAEEFKAAGSRQDFSALLAAVRRKLGDLTGSTTRSWNVNSRNLTTYVTLVQDSRYATERAETTAKAVETFTFVVRKDRATLLGYNIASTDLILR